MGCETPCSMIACVQPLLLRGGDASASTSPTRRAFAAPPPTYHRRRHCRLLPHALPFRASAAHGHAGAARFAVGASPLRLRATSHLSRLAGSSRPRAVYPPTHPDSRGPGGIILRCAPRPIPTGRGATSSLLLSNIFIRLLWWRCLGGDSPASRGTEASAEGLVGPPWRMESKEKEIRHFVALNVPPDPTLLTCKEFRPVC